MAKPVLVVVDDDDASREALARELGSRYGAHYQVVSSGSPVAALARLEQLAAEDANVPLILADQWMPEMTGTEFLARAKNLVPTARRALLISWADRPAAEQVLQAAALGWVEFYLPKPAWSPDEQFHRAVTESLEEWWRDQGGRYEAVTVIGEEPAARVHEIRDLLTRNNVPFGFHRASSPEGRAALQRLGVGEAAGPVVALYNGVVLVDPGNAEVAQALGTDVRPAGDTYDVAIVGAGPAGLAAAVYGASEGLATALLEREAFGGQAGTSSRIRNYLGFPHGVSGVELARRAFEQARVCGAHFIYGNPAVSLWADGDVRVVGLHDGSQVRARAVIIATGVSYRRLGIPGLEALAGAGVFYGAGTVEAQAVAGKPVFVVGGGNSAGQAALHLAKYASQVTILVRSSSLAASMSEYLIREIEHAPGINVRYRSEVTGGGGEGYLENVLLTDQESGQTQSLPAVGLFILIGAQPFTEWLPETVERDRWGFILTSPDTGHWPLLRSPFLLETSLYRFRTRHGSRDLRFGWMSRVGQDRGLCLLVSSI
jgi:thioredoxin reductase (NADPH)